MERTGSWTREKDRGWSSAPKRSRNLGRLQEQVMMLHAKGLSADEIQGRLLTYHGVSLSEDAIQDMLKRVMPGFSAWQGRWLAPYYERACIVRLVIKVKHQKRSLSRRAYAILGIDPQGDREVLGLWLRENSQEKFWEAVLLELKLRGICGISTLIGTESKGLTLALASIFPETKLEACVPASQADSCQPLKPKQHRRACQGVQMACDLQCHCEEAVQGLYMSLRKAIRMGNPFPGDEAAFKALFWRVMEWKASAQQQGNSMQPSDDGIPLAFWL